MADDHPSPLPQPHSLGGHVIPEDRASLIRQHMATLAKTALATSDQLPFQADVSDFLRVLEDEAEK